MTTEMEGLFWPYLGESAAGDVGEIGLWVEELESGPNAVLGGFTGTTSVSLW